MARRPKDKKTPDIPGLPPLSREAAEDLKAAAARVAQALEGHPDLKTLLEMVDTRPQDPVWDLHLMAALSALTHPAIPPLLAALFAGDADKARRKALKRALHALKSRGVAVAPDLLPREEALHLQAGGVAPLAHVSQVLGNGERYVVLEGPRDLLGGNVLMARLHDQGFRECHVLDLKTKMRQEFWDTMSRGGLIRFRPAPLPYALRLLEEAYEANPKDPGASTYGAQRDRLLAPERPEAAPDLAARFPEAALGEQSRLLEESRRLPQDPLFYTWLRSPEEMAPWLDKVQGVMESPLILSDLQKQARIDGLLDEAAAALFPPETRALWGRRLREMAAFLLLNGRRDDARAVWAAAADLAAEKTRLTGEAVFLKELVRLSLVVARDLKEGPEKEESPLSLLAPPTEPFIIRS